MIYQTIIKLIMDKLNLNQIQIKSNGKLPNNPRKVANNSNQSQYNPFNQLMNRHPIQQIQIQMNHQMN